MILVFDLRILGFGFGFSVFVGFCEFLLVGFLVEVVVLLRAIEE